MVFVATLLSRQNMSGTFVSRKPARTPRAPGDRLKRPTRIDDDSTAAAKAKKRLVLEVKKPRADEDSDASSVASQFLSEAASAPPDVDTGIDVDTGPDVDFANLQLSYVAGSLALAESEKVASHVILQLNKTVPEFQTFVQTLDRDSAATGTRIMDDMTTLIQQLTLSIRELAVGGMLTNWNEAALAVADARQALKESADV
jgi:hypothetical protein